MRRAESREGATTLPVTGTENRSHRPSSRSKPVKEETKGPAHPVISLNPSDGLTVLYGHPAVSRFALQALVDHALSGHPVVYLDGAHTFDGLLIERLARSRRQQLRKALAMIHVARAFSARQLERLMSHCLAGALDRYQAGTAVISGLLETLSADGLTDHEVNHLANRMIESVRHLTLQGFSLLCPCPHIPIPMAPAHRLFTILRSISHRCIHVHEEQGKVLTEEISVDAIPACRDSIEGIGSVHPSPSNPTASTLQVQI